VTSIGSSILKDWRGSFHTLVEVPIFGEDSTMTHTDGQEACCIPLYRNKTSANEKSEGSRRVPMQPQNPEAYS